MQILLTTKKRNIVCFFIRWFTKDKDISWKDVPTHAAIRFSGKESNWMIQSHAGGVGPYWWPHFKKENEVMYTFEMTGVNEKELEAIIEKFINKIIYRGYDYLAIVGFIFGQLKRKLFGITQTHNKWGSNNRIFCSELVVKMIQFYEKKKNIDILLDMDSEASDPLSLMRAMDKSKYFKRIK